MSSAPATSVTGIPPVAPSSWSYIPVSNRWCRAEARKCSAMGLIPSISRRSNDSSTSAAAAGGILSGVPTCPRWAVALTIPVAFMFAPNECTAMAAAERPVSVRPARIVLAGEIPRAQSVIQAPAGGRRTEEEQGLLPLPEDPVDDEITGGAQPVPRTERGQHSHVFDEAQRLAEPVIDRDRRFAGPDVMPAATRYEQDVTRLHHRVVEGRLAQPREPVSIRMRQVHLAVHQVVFERVGRPVVPPRQEGDALFPPDLAEQVVLQVGVQHRPGPRRPDPDPGIGAEPVAGQQ